MGCAYGWIVTLRREGAFFPVEQLLVHGEWILALADTVTEPPAQDAGQRQQIYVYRCAKMYLRCEIANCYASRGQYERSLVLMEQALGEIEGTDLTIHAQGMVAKVACDAVVDAMTSDQTPERVAVFAQRAVTELSRFEHVVNPGARPLIATIAYQAAHAMRTLTTPKTLTLIDKLTLIAARNHTSTLPVEQVNQIHRNIKRGNFTAALALISQLRKPDSSVYDNIMYDNFEAIANLHLSRLTPAADAIDRVLAAAGGGPHLLEHLKLSCGEIGAALQATRPSWINRSARLAAQQTELQSLHAKLTE